MKLKIASKKILKRWSLISTAERFERNELFIGLLGVIFVSFVGGAIFYLKAYQVVVSEPSVDIQEIGVNKTLLQDAVLYLEDKSKLPSERDIIDPFR